MAQQHTYLFNIRDDRGPSGTHGVLLLTVDTTTADRDAEGTLEALKRALVVWINTSPEGRAAWDEYGAFNVGDLANIGASAALMQALATEHICGYTIRDINFDLALDHDSSLVTEAQVTRRDDNDAAKSYTVPAGKYVFGDPCYFDDFDAAYDQMHKNLFTPGWEDRHPLAYQGTVTAGGTPLRYLQACTVHGDGGYDACWPGQRATTVGVDSGTLALVQWVDGITEPEFEHTTVEFANDTVVTIQGGDWYIGMECVCRTS